MRQCAVARMRQEVFMEEKTILVGRRPGYRSITLNRPQRLNAFSESMHRELKVAIDAAESDTPAARCC